MKPGRLMWIWLASRLCLFGVAGWAALAFSHHPANYLVSPLGPFWDAWNKWDTRYFLEIAGSGYHSQFFSTAAWLPGYPLLIRLSGLTSEPLINAILVANLCLLAALAMGWRLLRLDQTPEQASRSLVWLLTFPSAFLLSAPMSESAFLFFSLGAFWAARTRRWPVAGLLGAAAALTRPVGLLLGPALLCERPGRRGLLWLSLIPLAQLGFCFYLHQRIGDFWGLIHMQRRAAHYVSGWVRLANGHWEGPQWMGLIFAAVSLSLLALGWRKMRPSERVYSVLSLLLPLAHSLWVSQMRLMLVVFPLFSRSAEALPRWLPLLCFLLQLVGLAAYAVACPWFLY